MGTPFRRPPTAHRAPLISGRGASTPPGARRRISPRAARRCTPSDPGAPCKHAALCGARLGGRGGLAREGMRSARFGEAAHEALVVAVEEDHAPGVAALAEPLRDLGRAPEGLAAARIPADRALRLA